MPYGKTLVTVVTLLAAIAVAAPASSAQTPGSVSIPPQTEGPLTVDRFVEAVNNQGTHLARLRRLGDVPGTQVTVINIANLHPSGSASADAAANRASRRTSVRAATERAVVSSALGRANVSADNVVAIAVRGHLLNDVTIYHR